MARNCTPSALEQFPSGLFSKELRQDGVIVLHIVIALYMFAALAIICHDYFVPAMERVAKVCKIDYNVVGASIMPAIASTPQLFITVIGVFLVKDDIGLGSVVGSTFFNVLLVPGIFALVVKEAIQLHWWPVARDCFVYFVSVLTLTTAMADGFISLADTVMMLVIYLLYVIVLYFNHGMEKLVTKCINFCASRCCPGSTCLTGADSGEHNPDNESHILVNRAIGSSYQATSGETEKDLSKDSAFTTPKYVHLDGTNKEEIPMENKGKADPAAEAKAEDAEAKESDHKTEDNTMEEMNGEYKSIMTPPKTKGKLALWIILLPVIVPIFILVPDCKRPGCWQSCYLLTIISSVFCIGITSYVLVWMMAIVGDTFNINDIIIGMTVLAIGGSLTDMLDSIFVARDGHGDMALANSIGSNIFEILFCLAVPWMIQTAINNEGLELQGKMAFVSISLVTSSLIPFVLISLNNWVIDKKLGGIMIIMYGLFIVLDTYYEMETSPPPCE